MAIYGGKGDVAGCEALTNQNSILHVGSLAQPLVGAPPVEVPAGRARERRHPDHRSQAR